ncbi:MAG TPA: hypothetical protein V6D26_02310 [Stenomitos sp.]
MAAKQLELGLAAETLCQRLTPLDLTTYAQDPYGHKFSIVVLTPRYGL